MSGAKHVASPKGEHCAKCGRNEQQCALTWPCCLECRHWRGLDVQGHPIDGRTRRSPSTEERMSSHRCSDPQSVDGTPEVVADPCELPSMTTDTTRPMNPLERLELEGIPGLRLPKVDCGDGPTARMMAVERQRALWALAHDDASPVIALSGVPVTEVAS